MFSKIAILSFVSVLAAATETIPVTYPTPTPTTISQCDTSEAYCCNSVGQANTLAGVSAILALLNIALDPVTAIVGVTCSPITVGAGGGANCAQQPVCCTNNSFNGVINIGCVPVSL
ncbi:hypothetical protein M422DRAFT_784712 [Sphaerobolus stellatus SS14]|uniref:Hydrophobin n=1 Tax=Sphaerobolus stellatus (strain SS14) TaxID=990650 RepID=A0A0C9TF62_SPHS4|nr:hypothetical protein M422DRAFT_784711 [Sphaerobolus stellatus SS14]KIJ27928.1 hypothetical protein M422DRAFT_784712 [Sphaerobolus stellatus SS14]